MSAANPIVATRHGRDVLVVDETFKIALDSPELDTSDAHTVVLRIECGLRCADSAADRAMLSESFLADGSTQLALTGVEDHLSRHSMPAIRKLVATLQAEPLLADASAAVSETARKALDGAAFACGLEIVPPLTVSARSPSIERQRKLEQARARQQEAAKLQQDALGRANDLARQIQELRSNGGKLTDALAAAGAADRGELIKAAFLNCADSRATVRVAAGTFLVSVDASRSNAEPVSTPVPSLGALRSIRHALLDKKNVLLLGARGRVRGRSRVHEIDGAVPDHQPDQRIRLQLIRHPRQIAQTRGDARPDRLGRVERGRAAGRPDRNAPCQ
ncbi:MAG: hypothetical protein QM770_18365 [Tepidisphaeraceae bacterium]